MPIILKPLTIYSWYGLIKQMRDPLPVSFYYTAAWKIFEKRFLLIFLLVLLIDIPLETVSNFFGPEAYSTITRANFGKFLASVFLVGISVAVLKNISLTAIVYLTSETFKQKRGDLLNIVSFALKRWWIVSLTSLVSLVVVLALLVLGVIPGIIMMVLFSFVVQITVLEDKGFMAALKESVWLIKGHWWYVFKQILLIWFPLSLAMGLTSFGVEFIMKNLGLTTNFIPAFLTILIGYYGWIVFTLFYLSYRTK